MAYKTFAAGDVLTASDVQTYLADQAVIVCTAATRPGSPAEGMCIYETDTNLTRVYDGTNWAMLGPKRGLSNTSSDGSGDVTVTHSCGYAPTAVVITVADGVNKNVQLSVVTAITSTTFTVRSYNAGTGVALASTPTPFYWMAS